MGIKIKIKDQFKIMEASLERLNVACHLVCLHCFVLDSKNLKHYSNAFMLFYGEGVFHEKSPQLDAKSKFLSGQVGCLGVCLFCL